MKPGLSIIIPFVGEYPQVLFTIQAAAQGLIDRKLDFEIVAIDNYCEQAYEQARVSARQQMEKLVRQITGYVKSPNPTDDMLPKIEDFFEMHKAIYPTYENRAGGAIQACAGKNPWLKYIRYEDRLSHWQAKQAGVEASQYDTLLFLDAHTIPSGEGIYRMAKHYRFCHLPPQEGVQCVTYSDVGTMHMPLTYKILEWRRLIYKMVIENDAFYTYSFTGFRPAQDPYEVPVMSTCGMMISREIFDRIGGWPCGLGIYGGGENYMNYTLAVTGYKKFIYPHATLFHHGEKRDYHYIGDDTLQNRMIAHYLFDGYRGLMAFRNVAKGRPQVLDLMVQAVQELHKDHRQKIKAIQKYDIKEWTKQWMEGK